MSLSPTSVSPVNPVNVVALLCPHCGADKHADKHQVKNGTAPGGTARFKCQHCQRTYAQTRKPHGYDAAIRLSAVRMYLDGIGFRRAGRLLGVNAQSVANWVKEYHRQACEHVTNFPHENAASSANQTQEMDERTGEASLDVVEGDELFTFVGEKKTEFTFVPGLSEQRVV